MNCELIEEPLGNGKSRYSCPNCLDVFVFTSGFAHAKKGCRAEAPPPGPGGHLELLIRELTVSPCQSKCFEHAREMDRNGIQWCRDNRETIKSWLKESLKHVEWKELVAIANRARKVEWLKVLSPIDSLLDEAIRRSELPSAVETPPTSS